MPPVRKRRANKPDLETNTPPDVPAQDLAADVKRKDQPEMPPDSLPPRDESGEKLAVGGGFTPAEDGGVEQHPLHDDDQEDRTPSDYERELDRLDAAARSKAG
jgi:hypothetical protein